MRKIIQINAADGDGAQRIKAGRRRFHRYVVILRVIRERYEAGETTSLILQRSELAQMIHAVSQALDVAVKHRAGAAAAEPVPGAMHVQIFGGGFLALGNSAAHVRLKNFRAAAGERIETGGLQFNQRLFDGFFR